MFCEGPAKQAADFAKVELCYDCSSLLARIGIDVTENSDHFLGELPAVWTGVQAKKASIQG